MLFNVPQFINIEDKIVGPFTAKQLGWLVAGGLILMILWNILTQEAFTIAAIIIVAVVGALAFFRPYGQSFSQFLFFSFSFLFHPKIYVWQRNYDNIKMPEKNLTQPDKKEIPKNKKISSEKLEKISALLDENGRMIRKDNFPPQNDADSEEIFLDIAKPRISRIVEDVVEKKEKFKGEKKPMKISFSQDWGSAKSQVDLPDNPAIKFKS